MVVITRGTVLCVCLKAEFSALTYNFELCGKGEVLTFTYWPSGEYLIFL